MSAADLFALEPATDVRRYRWEPSPLLLTPTGTLQGGAGLGAAVAAMETASGRPAVWATAQYLSFAAGTDPVDLDVTIEVEGHNTTQARCVVSRADQEILTTHAALGRRDLTEHGVWTTMPDVAPPDACPPYAFFEKGQGDIGEITELRLATGRQLRDLDGKRGDGSFCLWGRCWEGRHQVTVADLALIGDFMPLGFADAMGAPYSGNSLDNTVRVGNLVPTEWILLSAHTHQVVNGFGHGRANLWADDGTLLGEVSQTAVIRLHTRIKQRSVGG